MRRSVGERTIALLKSRTILATGYRGRLTELPDIARMVSRLKLFRPAGDFQCRHDGEPGGRYRELFIKDRDQARLAGLVAIANLRPA